MTTNRRVQKLEAGLTPKQAILLWIQEAHAFHSVEDYVSDLMNQPKSAWPMVRLPDQVEAKVRESLKGQPKEEINRAVRQAWRDVLLLFHLHQQANRVVSFELNHRRSRTLVLITGLKGMMREQDLERKLHGLDAFKSEIRPWPHPRSRTAVENLARLRGAQAGVPLAEAFQLVWERIGV